MIALSGPERTGEVFQTLLLLFKYLAKGLVNDLSPVQKHFGGLLGHAKPYVRQFAGKTFSFLLRKIKGARLGAALLRIVHAVGRTGSEERLIDGTALLMFETLRNVQSESPSFCFCFPLFSYVFLFFYFFS